MSFQFQFLRLFGEKLIMPSTLPGNQYKQDLLAVSVKRYKSLQCFSGTKNKAITTRGALKKKNVSFCPGNLGRTVKFESQINVLQNDLP